LLRSSQTKKKQLHLIKNEIPSPHSSGILFIAPLAIKRYSG